MDFDEKTYIMSPKVAKRMLGRVTWKLEEHYKEINAINEFPVPDKDTGTNMYATIGGASLEVWGREYGSDFTAFCNDIQEGLLDSISGNAGTISAEFLSGFFEGLAPYANKPLGPNELYQGFWQGKVRAFKSVHDPKEGTMLDVIHAAENRARMCSKENVREMFTSALAAAKEDLPHTRERNPVLKKAGVQDAGALGFVFLLEGLHEGMFNEEEIGLPERVLTMDFSSEISNISDISEDTNLENPYEVQFILEPLGGIQEVNEFRRELGKLGDSLDTFSTKDMSSVRVHIHTNDVESVQGLAEKYGDTSHVRAIDMREEIKARRGERRKIMIVTDAGADLPWSVLAQGVLVVPFKLLFPERRQLSGTFYERMLRAKEWPTTSQPSPGAFAKQIKDALKLAEEVFVITISSKLSRSHNSAIQAIKSLNERDSARVTLFDSGQAACGQALLVEKALSMSKDKTVDEIVLSLKFLQECIRLYGYPSNVEYLIRMGRLKGGKAKAAKMFQRIGMHPQLFLQNGVIRPAHLLPDFGSFAKNLNLCVIKRLRHHPRYEHSDAYAAISYADMKQEAVDLKRSLERQRIKVLFIERLNRVIGTHTGPALLVAWYEKQ